MHRGNAWWAVAMLCCLVCWMRMSVLAGEVMISRTESDGPIRILWTSETVTVDAPYIHPEFQVESSSNLAIWEEYGDGVPGGTSAATSIPLEVPVLPPGAQGLFRLSSRVDLAGMDLSGRDLSGADLRAADLHDVDFSGANLSDADLSGALVTGATFAGADLAGANLEGVNLDGLDLVGVDLSQIFGTPNLTRWMGDPATLAVEVLPQLPPYINPDDFVGGDPNLPGLISFRDAMVVVRPAATLAEFNALLAQYGAAMVGCQPRDAVIDFALLRLRFPTTTPSELYAVTEDLMLEPIIRTAVPDMFLGENVVPDDSGGASVNGQPWSWGNGGASPDGGNWGWESARVPQMWNLKDGAEKDGIPSVRTCVLDNWFTLSHQDLDYAGFLYPAHFRTVVNGVTFTPSNVSPHGNLVAGIIGATYDNQLGLDGVNPYAELFGCFHASSDPRHGDRDFVDPLRKKATGYGLVYDFSSIGDRMPDARILNVSLGFNWHDDLTQPLVEPLRTQIETLVARFANPLAEIVREKLPNTLVVCAAGNDGTKMVSAELNSPMTYAALSMGIPNILVVGAHGLGGNLTEGSSRGAPVAAPGIDMLSAGLGNAEYLLEEGTSMASPFAAGIAGFLLAVDDGLTPTQLRDLIILAGDPVDAFASVMEIDVQQENKDVLLALLDIDDGTLDGATRIDIPPPSSGEVRSFKPVTSGTINTNDVRGNGTIDMSDFRRWRDWFLFGDRNESLNGDDDHDKHDANRDGKVDRSKEIDVFPRGDFNGDGKMRRNATMEMPGVLKQSADQPMKDVDVLMESQLWPTDPDYPYPVDELPDLIDSVDVTVFAEQVFSQESAITEADIAVYDVKTEQPVDYGKVIPFSPGNNTHQFTVPVGKTYYVSSAPIALGGGTNVVLGSVGEGARTFGEARMRQGDRGADYAVDLAVVEKTVEANVELVGQGSRRGGGGGGASVMKSEPVESEVDAYLPADSGFYDEDADSAGSRGWVNDQGTFYALARTGDPTPSGITSTDMQTQFARTVWRRSFIKQAGLGPPTFHIDPIELRIIDGFLDLIDLEAQVELRLEKRVGGSASAWDTVFHTRTAIAGYSTGLGGSHTFQVVDHQGDLPQQPLKILETVFCSGPPEQPNCLTIFYGAEYLNEAYEGTIPIDDIGDGGAFEVRYTLEAQATSRPVDEMAEAYIGDPLRYGSGHRMAYGEFGELPVITEFMSDDGLGNAIVGFLAKPGFYYILCRADDTPETTEPIALRLGTEGPDSFADPSPPAMAEVQAYTVKNQPLDQPLDVDGDGIDDVYELLHPLILDPLNAADALLDPDGDGRPTLREYLDGTNPELADPAPEFADALFPDLRVDIGVGGDVEAGDLNADGFIDFVSYDFLGVNGVLGGTNESFLPPVITDVNNGATFVDLVLDTLNGDAFPDAAMVRPFDDELWILTGLGNGGFQTGVVYTTSDSPQRVVTGDFNQDQQTDLLVICQSSKTVDLFAGNGDGTFLALAGIAFDVLPHDAVLAHLDADTHVDLAVVLALSQLMIFPGRGDGTFDPPQLVDPGLSPLRVVAGKLNPDSHTDLVTANASDDSISILIGNGNGTFQPPIRIETGDNPRNIAVVDVNQDGALDLVVSHSTASHHAVLLNDGLGGFPTLRKVFSSTTQNTLVTDVDHDGWLDIVARETIHHGLGNGEFDSRYEVVIPAFFASDWEVVDSNSDGWLDLLVANQQADTVEVLLGQAGGSLGLAPPLALPPNVVGMAAGALDGGNTLDLAVVTERPDFFPGDSTNALHVLLGNGLGGYALQPPIPLTDKPRDVLIGDLNGDGLQDALVMLTASGQAAPFLGQGPGTFTPQPLLEIGFPPTGFDGRDVNGDGRMDLLVRQWTGTRYAVRVYTAEPAGSLVQSQEVLADNNGSIVDFTFHDFSGDAAEDLVAAVATGGSTQLFVFERGTNGVFGAQSDALAVGGELAANTTVRIVDLDGDQLPDLIAQRQIRLGLPNGGFGDPHTYAFPGTQVEAYDLNQDQKLDLVNPVRVWLQR